MTNEEHNRRAVMAKLVERPLTTSKLAAILHGDVLDIEEALQWHCERGRTEALSGDVWRATGEGKRWHRQKLRDAAREAAGEQPTRKPPPTPKPEPRYRGPRKLEAIDVEAIKDRLREHGLYSAVVVIAATYGERLDDVLGMATGWNAWAARREVYRRILEWPGRRYSAGDVSRIMGRKNIRRREIYPGYGTQAA